MHRVVLSAVRARPEPGGFLLVCLDTPYRGVRRAAARSAARGVRVAPMRPPSLARDAVRPSKLGRDRKTYLGANGLSTGCR